MLLKYLIKMVNDRILKMDETLGTTDIQFNSYCDSSKDNYNDDREYE
jgi:hypothetical protein